MIKISKDSTQHIYKTRLPTWWPV